MLRPLWASTIIASLPVDPGATFTSGQCAGLVQIAGETFCTVSNGGSIPVIGLIDDERNKAFTGTVIEERHIIPCTPILGPNNILVSQFPVQGYLNEENIEEASFSSNMDLILNPKKGVVTIKKDTPLNYQDDTGVYGFELVCSYRFRIITSAGNITTDGSGKVSVHFGRGVFMTDQFDILHFPTKAGQSLYVNPNGLLTVQETNSPIVAISWNAPSAVNSELLFMWL